MNCPATQTRVGYANVKEEDNCSIDRREYWGNIVLEYWGIFCLSIGRIFCLVSRILLLCLSVCFKITPLKIKRYIIKYAFDLAIFLISHIGYQ